MKIILINPPTFMKKILRFFKGKLQKDDLKKEEWKFLFLLLNEMVVLLSVV